MASPISPTMMDEKKVITTPPMVHTTRIREKSSVDTLGSPAFTPVSPGSPARRSSDVSTPTAVGANPFDTDVEAMVPAVTRDTTNSATRSDSGRKPSHWGSRNQDCQVWPNQRFWKTKAKAAKRKNHSCNCLSSLSPRNRMIVKILIGLFIVAAAIGIGFGISKPLGAGIWRPSK